MDEEEQATPNNNGPTVNEADDTQEVIPVIPLITHPRQTIEEEMNQRTANHGSPVQIQSPAMIDGSRKRRAPVYETDILANKRTDKDTHAN